MTAAWLVPVSDTWLTFADAAEASGEVDCSLSTAANSCPSCSSCTRREFGVLALKNVAQLVSIADTAPAPLVGSAPELGDAELDGVPVEVDGGVVVLVVDGLELLLHAVSARPMRTGSAAIIRRVGA